MTNFKQFLNQNFYKCVLNGLLVGLCALADCRPVSWRAEPQLLSKWESLEGLRCSRISQKMHSHWTNKILWRYQLRKQAAEKHMQKWPSKPLLLWNEFVVSSIPKGQNGTAQVKRVHGRFTEITLFKELQTVHSIMMTLDFKHYLVVINQGLKTLILYDKEPISTFDSIVFSTEFKTQIVLGRNITCVLRLRWKHVEVFKGI